MDSKKTKKSLSELPNELIFEIFLFIIPNDIVLTFTFVSKRFSQLANQPVLWKKYTILKNEKNETKSNELFEKFKSWKLAFLHSPNPVLRGKMTYVPNIGGTRESTIYDSKFQGTPFISADEEYPKCISCKKSLQSHQSFLQINLKDFNHPTLFKHFFLPWDGHEGGQGREGLIQWFQCSCGKSNTKVIKKDPAQLELKKDIPRPNPGAWFAIQERVIDGWEEVIDEPKKVKMEEWKMWEVGEEFILECKFEDICGEPGDPYEEESYPKQGDKFLGTPNWIQYDETPECKNDDDDDSKKRKMILLFCMDSDSGHDNLGDGALNIFIDPKNLKESEFVYQCT